MFSGTELPPGYVEYDTGRTRVVATRLDMETMLALLCGPERDRDIDTARNTVGEGAASGESVPAGVYGGRGGARRIKLPGGKVVYLRHYLRGGLIRHFLRDLYLVRPPRPLCELFATEIARAAGCYVPTVHAACVEDTGPFYRGWIVTSAIEETRPFIERWLSAEGTARRDLLAAAGAAVGAVDAAGVYHADLTGHNVLVDAAGRVALIDFDRASVGAAGNVRLIERGTDRFRRSLVKLTAAADATLDEDDFRRFRDTRMDTALSRLRAAPVG